MTKLLHCMEQEEWVFFLYLLFTMVGFRIFPMIGNLCLLNNNRIQEYNREK